MKFIYLILAAMLCYTSASAQVIETEEFGINSHEPGYNYSAGCKDIVNGVNYYYLTNSKISLNFGTTAVSNGEAGSKHPGALMDAVLKSNNLDNIDWAQFMINDDQYFSLTDQNKFPQIDSIRINNNQPSINVFAKAKNNPNFKLIINCSLLKDQSIIKYKIKIKNTSNNKISKYLSYVVDVDEASMNNSYIPSLGYNYGDNSTTPPGQNYIYYGLINKQASNLNVHGISWIESAPNYLISNPFYFGINYKTEINPKDSLEIVFYQLIAKPDKNYPYGPIQSILNLISVINDSDDYLKEKIHVLSGKVEDENGNIVSNALVTLIDSSDKIIQSTTTDITGAYKFYLNLNSNKNRSFKIDINALSYGYKISKLNLNANANFTHFNFTKSTLNNLYACNVDASFNKKLNVNGAITSIIGDLILENQNLVIAISNFNNSSKNILRGDVIDIYLKNYNNLETLEWYKPNNINLGLDSLDYWWINKDVKIDTLYILYKSNNKVIARASGRFYKQPVKGVNDSLNTYNINDVNNINNTEDAEHLLTDLKFMTDYILESNSSSLKIITKIFNGSNNAIYDIYYGDVLKSLGSGARSYIPEFGEILGDFGRSSDFLFKSEDSWLAHYSNEKTVFGLIFENMPSSKYAVKRWASSLSNNLLKPNDSINYVRYITAANANSEYLKEKYIYSEYLKLNNLKNKVDVEMNINHNQYAINDTLILNISVKNNVQSNAGLQLNLKSPYFFNQLDTLPSYIFLLPKQTKVYKLKFIVLAGGKDAFKINYTTDSFFKENIVFHVLINDIGWFSGDNHTHSKFSDGGSTIEDNLTVADSKGLAFISATDHNTINHFSEVNRLNSKYKNFIIISGDEITSDQGHFLVYNVNGSLPWVFNSVYTQQTMFDLVNNNTTKYGRGFTYVAHPNDLKYKWQINSYNGLTGLEIWNSLNSISSSGEYILKKSFALWDSLNLKGKQLFGASNSDAHNALNVGNNFIRAYLNGFTQQEIINVLRDKGAFYGTNGPHVNFTINNNLMGSKLQYNANSRYVVNILAKTYDDQIKISEVRLIKNGTLYKSWSPNQSSFNVKFIDSVNINAFFRVEVVCTRNNFAFTNPIWINMKPNLSTASIVQENAAELKINYNITDEGKSFNKTSVSDTLTLNRLKVYPNPASNYLSIENLVNNEIVDYRIFDMSGRLIQLGKITNVLKVISIEHLQSANYLLVIDSEQGTRKEIISIVK